MGQPHSPDVSHCVYSNFDLNFTGLSKLNGFAYKMEGTSGMVLKFSIITSIFSVLRIWIGGRWVQRGRQIDLRFNSDMKLH